MGRVVAFVDDLFFQSKLLETARHVGVELSCVGTGEALLAQVQTGALALVVVDLNARSNPLAAIELLAACSPAPVVAFLSHVQVDLAERARRAGCREVMPRSQFTRELPQILARAKT
jgi:DNA-binding NarL/FixJ family response regulator